MSYFSEVDRKVIESLEYTPNLKPNFEVLKSCLIWDDERPNRISNQGYEKLCDLWIARFFIYHSGLPEKKWWVLDVEYFKNTWKVAYESNIQWPGFKDDRLYLSQENKKYLLKELKKIKKL